MQRAIEYLNPRQYRHAHWFTHRYRNHEETNLRCLGDLSALPPRELQEQVVHRENRGKHLDLLALWGYCMLPLVLCAELVEHEHQVEGSVCLPEAVMRASAKNKPILALLFSVACDPSHRLKIVWLLVGLWVMQRQPGRRNNHGALLGHVVHLWNGEVFLDDVGDHQDWWAIAEGFFDNCTCVFLHNC